MTSNMQDDFNTLVYTMKAELERSSLARLNIASKTDMARVDASSSKFVEGLMVT